MHNARRWHKWYLLAPCAQSNDTYQRAAIVQREKNGANALQASKKKFDTFFSRKLMVNI